MTPAYDEFIAADWSGAREAQGIAVAVCRNGAEPPALILPPGAPRWSRAGVLVWLADRLAGGARLLVGFDFAFALPLARAAAYLHGSASAFDLWHLVERVCREDKDYYGGRFAAHPDYAGDFWHRGKADGRRPVPHRMTDWACRDGGHGSPESPYKLIGAKQVGKAALAGMRVLHALRAEAAGQARFWPMEPDDGITSTVVEIYPRLFIRHCGRGNAKLRTAAELNACLERLGSDAVRFGRAISDHETDALISAAGLRCFVTSARAWAPAGMDETVCREGWIFGVGA